MGEGNVYTECLYGEPCTHTCTNNRRTNVVSMKTNGFGRFIKVGEKRTNRAILEYSLWTSHNSIHPRDTVFSPFYKHMSNAYPWRESRRLLHNRVSTHQLTILNRYTDSSAYSPLSWCQDLFLAGLWHTHIGFYNHERCLFIDTWRFVAKLNPDLKGWSERDIFKSFYST